MDPMALIDKYYQKNTRAYYLLVNHGKIVAEKSLEIAKRLKDQKIDLKFLEEGAMLHDIGIKFTNVPELGCYGDQPYILHTTFGKELLEKEGFPKHALVCERHIGIAKEEIVRRKLPLPKRDMLPLTIEEEIISFVDKFYSKNDEYLKKPKSIEYIKKQLSEYGGNQVEYFEKSLKKFGKI